jgi:D-tyrosyl-tRNA(Tyr) deacylase
MRVVIQRVSRAAVRVEQRVVGSIGAGVLILLGVHADDGQEQAQYLAQKVSELRIFEDAQQKMNFSLVDVGGAALVVSQFTLFGDCSKGRRPNFMQAAPPEKGRQLYEYFVEQLSERIADVQTGEFGAMMAVELVNDGPVTLIMDR